MDIEDNPYTPGAGSNPPELAGRGGVREKVQVMLERSKRGYPEQSIFLLGLRGTGKTVLLNRMYEDAEEAGICALWMEASEHRSLPSLLLPKLKSAMFKFLPRGGRVAERAVRALRALSGAVKKLQVKLGDIGLTIEGYEPMPGVADSGDLENDLSELIESAGKAAKEGGTCIALFMDEMQYVPKVELASLLAALHSATRRGLPIVMVGAGLPNLQQNAGNAKTYSERLLDFERIGALDAESAAHALRKPARDAGVEFEQAAIDRMIMKTEGYPYFLQEWGKHAWNAAEKSPITENDVNKASQAAIARLDDAFFSVRYARLTVRERCYLRAMSELGKGPHRTGDIAKELGKSASAVGMLRKKLIEKGMIWSPGHGETAFTAPLFDKYMHRSFTDSDWRNWRK